MFVRRMMKTRTLDILGFVAGISFLISGIIVRSDLFSLILN